MKSINFIFLMILVELAGSRVDIRCRIQRKTLGKYVIIKNLLVFIIECCICNVDR